MSFAIIETGGKQYKVKTSKIMNIERVSADKSNLIKFKKVLLLSDDSKTEIGSPNLEGALVEAKLIKNIKDKKILVFHKEEENILEKKMDIDNF